MGKDELKKALADEAEERIRALWAVAETEIDGLRGQVALQREEQAAKSARQLDKAVAELRTACHQQALEEGRRAILEAETDLAERMLGVARTLLPQMIAAKRSTWLKCLAEELPDHPWEEVRVSPADLDQAVELFPGAQVIPEEALAGGVIVTAGGGRLRVDNSLEKRLERRWPEILPMLFAEIRRKAAEDDNTPATTT